MSMKIRALALALIVGLTATAGAVGAVGSHKPATRPRAAQLCAGLRVGESAPDACIPLP